MLRAHSDWVSSGRRAAYTGLGSYLVFVAILQSIWLLCASWNVGTVGRSLPGCRPGVGRASTDQNSDGARPYGERASPDSFYCANGRRAGDLSKGRLRNVTGLISNTKYARLPGECEIQRLSCDPQIWPEIVGYVT